MQSINNDSSQCGRSVVYGTKEINYVGLTLKEFHSPANHKERLHLMLNSNMTDVPCHPAKLSNQSIQCLDRHGLQVQEEIGHLNQEHHLIQQNAQGDSTSTSPSQQLAVPYSTRPDQMLDWKDTESMNGDCTIPISWMNEVSHESYREAEAQVQNMTLPGEPHTFTGPYVTTSRQSHGWCKNTFGDSIARSSKDQPDLFGRLQLTSQSYALSSKLFGNFGRPYSTSSMSSCPNPRGFDTNFCTPVASSSHFEAEYQMPASQLTRGNLLRSNSAPAQEGFIPHENLLTIQPSMSLQLNFGSQGTKTAASIQGLPFLQMASDDLPDHKYEDGWKSSVRVELLKARMGSDVHFDTTRGCSNMSLESLPVQPTIRLPPLDLETVLGPSAAAADVPDLHGHDKNLKKYLTSANPEETVFLSDLPSLLRLNSNTGSSSMVSPTHASKSDKVQSESFSTPRKKRMAPRRSRFDPHDTPCTFVTERIRREKLTEKYNILKSLIPKSTKVDRASIIEETIAHVQSLKSQIARLEKMKQEKLTKPKRQKVGTAEGHGGLAFEQSGDVHCQWLKKTSRRGTEVDMRILQDELLVNIVQKHLPRFLLRMVTALETKLKLEILNATGSVIDGHDVYNFKVKITGNSCAVAHEIMTKILDTLDSVF